MLKNIAIIAAGGSGKRLGSDLPKQYLLLDSKPILMHTILAFKNVVDKIVVVIHPAMYALWKKQCTEHQFNIEHDLVFGGETRFQSVKKGLEHIVQNYAEISSNTTAIAVHDAARPLIDQVLIKKSFALCHQGQDNVLAVKSSNSVRLGTENRSRSLNRDQVWLIQTPQTFAYDTLVKAFQQPERDFFTDEASVVESLGYPISILESSQKNIKITYPEDFIIAQTYLK